MLQHFPIESKGRCKKMQEVYNLMMGYSYSSLLHFDPELGGVGLAYSRLLFLKEEVGSIYFLKNEL